MTENNRELVDYFISQTNERFDKLENHLHSIEHRIDTHKKYFWLVMGGGATAGYFIFMGLDIGLRLIN